MRNHAFVRLLAGRNPPAIDPTCGQVLCALCLLPSSIAKARRSPQGLQFQEFETLLSLCGWEFKRQTGSHRFWYEPQKYRLSIQPRKDGKAKAYQVKQFLEQYDRENETTT